MLLGVALHQQLGRFEAHAPAGLRGDGPGIDREEIAAGGQHIGPAARGRAAGAGGHKAPRQAAQQLLQLLRATGGQARAQILLHPAQHGLGVAVGQLGQCGRQGGAWGQNLQGQQLQALARVAVVAPALVLQILQVLKQGGARAGPGSGPVGIERVKVQAQIAGGPGELGVEGVGHGVQVRRGQPGLLQAPAG